MHGVNYIALAIPAFFLLIGVEIGVARIMGRSIYRLNDAVNDLSCGILQQVLGVFSRVMVVGVYVIAYEHLRLTTLSTGAWWTWVCCFLGVDLLYYWFHRISHESNLPWAAHVVHHQSEEYNLAVALRQSAFQPLLSWAFYLPLAWIGFPPIVFATCASLDTLYQFWIHTRLVGRLGPFELVFNTPSHHRVHHGRNPQYIDRNHAGVLIIWDRMFGTFEPEGEAVRYGITRPLRSWNPLWANFASLARLVRLSRRAPSVFEAVKIWFASPAYAPEWVVRADAPAGGEHYDAQPPRGTGAYAMVSFVVAIVLTVLLLFRADAMTLAARIALAGIVAWSLLDVGGLFESRRFVVPAELARLLALVLFATWTASPFGRTPLLVTAGVAAIACGALAAWLLRLRPRLAEPGQAPALQNATESPT